MRIPATTAMVAVFLSAAFSTSAQTADPAQAGMFQVYGAGASSCGTWLADREKLAHSIELNWVLGWLSASDAFTRGLGGQPLRHTDANAVSAWIDKYCREHPLKGIADASGELLTELAKPE